MKKLFIYIIFFFSLFNLKGQQLFYSDIFHGGVTGSGFALSYGSNGSGFFNVNIPVSSTIRKAFLISGRNGNAPNLIVDFNGNSLVFDSTNIVSNSFQSFYGGTSNVHAIEVTSYVSPSINQYFINITTIQQASANRYNEFYLYILYEDNSMPIMNTYVFLNNQDFGFANYNLINLNPINNTNDVGLSLFTGYICDTIGDGENIYIDGNLVGLIGSNDVNSGNCGGPYGDFYFENNQLFGLSDDTANSQMKHTDVLINMNSLITQNTTNFLLGCVPQELSPLNKSNNIWTFFLTYTTPCDTFNTTATALQDTICLGDSVQLNATGGVIYNWVGAFGGLSDTTIANPMASPPQTTTYIVTIKNDSGCVKTEHVKIWVTQPIDSITTTPTVCGNATGSIIVHYNTNANYNFTLYDNNFNSINNNTTGFFNQLAEGVYIVESTLHNCNFYDTVAVGYTNNVQAAFIRNPIQGKAPLTVTLTNISNNANQFIWLLPNDTFYSQHLTYTFTNGGSYPVCLVAYNNQPHCADTTCFTFVVEGNVGLIIPNIFTPNNDGHNDVFSIQVIDAELISTIEVIIYNRWGEKMYEYINNESTPELLLWDGVASSGNKASEGTYFYVITYKTKAGETITEKGTVSLLR